MKKLLLSAAMLLTLIFPFAHANAQQKVYNLPTEITDGNILHCFSWPLKYIKEELPNIAAAGFGSVQISPLQRPDIDEGWTWYTIYLPYDYHAYSSPGMGSREEFSELCKEADKYGIKIIVDVALNHVNKTSPYFNPWWSDKRERWREWGGDGSNIDYNSRWSITHNRLGDYVELNTENQEAIDRAVAFMKELRDLGAKGIRFDAAKHIELPSECDNGEGVWPAVTKVPGLFYYGEIVGDCVNGDDSKIREYAKYIWVPDNTYSTRAARENGGIHTAHAGGRDDMTGGHLIYWAESHDDYSNDEWSERVNQGIIDRSYCLLACRNTQAALYYSRPRARGKDNIKIEKGSLAFMGKHIVEVNKFRNAMVGKRDYFEYNYNNGNDVACVTREKGGAVIAAKGANTYVTVANGGGYCPSGTYKDRVSGNTFTVNSNTISGTVGPTGVAVIYNDNDYVSTPTPETVTITGSEEYNVAYAGNFSNGSNYIYYWKGKNDYGNPWPGQQMKRAKGDDGKYYWCFNVPTDADGIVFNNGIGDYAMQTDNLPIVRNYIMDNGGATITPVTFTIDSFEPEPAKTTKTVTIEGDYNIAYSGQFEYIHYWGGTASTDWPGVQMTKATGDDGNPYWCYKVPTGTTHVIFNNGKTGNEEWAKEQTGDLGYSGRYVMCESGATSTLVKFTKDGEEIDPANPTGLNVVWPEGAYCYFANDGNYSSPYMWSWSSTSGNCGTANGFPGDPMTYIATKYFWKAKDTSVSTFIISDNGSESVRFQTDFINGATYYTDRGHIGGDDYISTNPERLYMIGNFNDKTDWDPAVGALLRKIDEKGVYVGYNITLTKAASDNPYAYFSFSSKLGTWDELNSEARYGSASTGFGISANSPSHVTRSYNDANSWMVTPGTYDVIVDLYDMTVTLLKPQAAPTVEASQLVEVQEESPFFNTYNYITYRADGNKAYGVKVDGDKITATQISVSNDMYLNADVKFTDKVLVTTTFTNTNTYGLEAVSATIGKKQSDGKFYSIETLNDLDQNEFESRVNYYYTIKEGVEVKVPMTTPTATAAVRLAVPEPKFVHSGISVDKSTDVATFTYEGKEFEAKYNMARKYVEIEKPNITEGLDRVANKTGNLYKVMADGKEIEGVTFKSEEHITLDDIINGELTSAELKLVNNRTEFLPVIRWNEDEAKQAIITFEVTDYAPEVAQCMVKTFLVEYRPVEVNGGKETHLFESTGMALNVTTIKNSIRAKNSANNQITEIDLSHENEGDWYLVEVYSNDEMIGSAIVEGNDGERIFYITRDRGEMIAEDALAREKWYDSSNNPIVHVSTLYPFMSKAPRSAKAPWRVEGKASSSDVIETSAGTSEITVDNTVSGLESVIGGTADSVEYFNLQGIRVESPSAPGVYVVRHSNGIAEKVVIR